jgi:DNA-directed RNA polymerase specialized sigma24 family protein
MMTMPRTRAQLEQAAAAATAWLDSLDPDAISTPEADATDLRRIGQAMTTLATTEADLSAAVQAARAHGRTWGQIAAMLGVSRQAAQKRYDQPADHLAR